MSVRGRDAFVVQSLYADGQQSVNDKLLRLLLFIGALKDAGAASVTAMVPYLAYARKDQKSKPRDPVTTRYVAAMFEAVGTDRVVTMDVHNLAAFQNAFRCRTDHLQANGLFVAHFAPLVGERPVVVVAPDAGGIKRAERFRERLERTLGRPVAAAFAEKHRSEDVVSGDMMVGPVQGRCALAPCWRPPGLPSIACLQPSSHESDRCSPDDVPSTVPGAPRRFSGSSWQDRRRDQLPGSACWLGTARIPGSPHMRPHSPCCGLRLSPEASLGPRARWSVVSRAAASEPVLVAVPASSGSAAVRALSGLVAVRAWSGPEASPVVSVRDRVVSFRAGRWARVRRHGPRRPERSGHHEPKPA